MSDTLGLSPDKLRITRSPLDEGAGLVVAAFLVLDELFSRDALGRWIGQGSPVGRPDLVTSGADRMLDS
jgi:hypothetical protein